MGGLVARPRDASGRPRATTPWLCTLAALAALAAATVAPRASGAQEMSPALVRAMELEDAGKAREAATAYRAAAARGDGEELVAALLGLERVSADLGEPDSLLVALDPALRRKPADAVLRSIQLRVLGAAQREPEARSAFEAWRRAAPGEVAPYREYARLLLQSGKVPAADTVLQLAGRITRDRRVLAVERAQLHAALGAWPASAAAWRDALEESAQAEQGAVFALQAAPPAARDSVLAALGAPPPTLGARRAAAALAIQWGNGAAGWQALAELPPNDSTLAAWRDFAEHAEQAESWRIAGTAWRRVYDATRDPTAARRTAAASIAAGDAAGALALLDAVGGADDPEVLLLRLEALASVGRAADAEALLADSRTLDAAARARGASLVADAWVRGGDVARARSVLAASGADDEGEAAGWIALYGGDLKRARTLLRRPSGGGADAVLALAVLARARADSAPAIGAAFLALARRDSAGAAAAFERAAGSTPDAASLLVATAARLRAARGETPVALALWQRIAATWPDSPEAPEAELEWARLLRRGGDVAGARARYEHLIVTFPRSALVPLARRELEELPS